ncbi:HNH endonuclease family protein [Nocardiopsis sp. NPDC006938]|uniref:HNH endonuclease family protein n=1 Tax=Nocardiopsis sp. NPDC006938 TaxID=3364337 RepID=UPI0036B43B93
MPASPTPSPSPRPRARETALGALSAVAAAVLVAVLGWAAPAQAHHVLPPGIPSTSAAQSQLDGLTVRAKNNGAGYDRSLFPHWVVISSPCDARETVLRRDGHTVHVDGSCQPTSGRWSSEYDGVWTDQPSSFDIDHMVPLYDAWRSGAHTWSAAQRRSFANDVSSPQLWAVSASSNRSKGDRDPSAWMPPRTAIHCDYVKAWVNVKHRYNLSVTSAEKASIQGTINARC